MLDIYYIMIQLKQTKQTDSFRDLMVTRLDFSIVTASNFKYKSQRTRTQYRRLISTLLLGIDHSLGCGVFYRNRSYHSSAMTSMLFLLKVDFLEI